MKTLIKSTILILHYANGHVHKASVKNVPKYHRLGNCFTGTELVKHGSIRSERKGYYILPPIIDSSFNLERSCFA